MKIQFCSDLHLEFPENKNFLKKNPLIPSGDILIMAGDILPFRLIDAHADFFDQISDKYQTVYWVPGNHEYYHYDLALKTGSFTENIRKNVFLINNVSVELNNMKLIFSTLWSKISPVNQFFVQQRLSDFYVIGYEREMMQPFQYNKLHKESLAYIKSELKNTRNKNIVVVTHHVPTFENYPEKYKGDILNEAFATNLSSFILKSKITHWIFGHHHSNPDVFKIGKTTMLSNQLGYVSHKEQLQFDRKNYIEVI